MLTAVAEVATAVEAMRLGAHDHVLKPFALHDMLRKVADAINAGLTAQEQPKPWSAPGYETAPDPVIAVGEPLDDAGDDPLGDLAGPSANDLLEVHEDLDGLLEQVSAVKRMGDSLLGADAPKIEGDAILTAAGGRCDSWREAVCWLVGRPAAISPSSAGAPRCRTPWTARSRIDAPSGPFPPHHAPRRRELAGGPHLEPRPSRP